MRVTQILKAAGLIETAWFTAEAAERGTAMHNAAHDAVADSAQDGPVARCVYEAMRTASITVHDVERHYVHGVLEYEGHPDWVGTVGGHQAVIDLKTGTRQPWHGVQLAGYALLVADSADWLTAARLVDRYALYLDPPRWKLVPCRDDTDYLAFMEALYARSAIADR